MDTSDEEERIDVAAAVRKLRSLEQERFPDVPWLRRLAHHPFGAYPSVVLLGGEVAAADRRLA